jgi:uncharacterized protein (TIGR03067 family)
MRWQAFTLASILLVAAGSRGGDDAKKDLQAMDGTWAVTVHEKDGVKTPDELNQKLKMRLVIKEGKYVVSSDDKEVTRGSIKLDAAKKPREIDATDEGTSKGTVLKGIYELSGDEMKVCFGAPGEERPKEFKTSDKSPSVLLGYKRVKK